MSHLCPTLALAALALSSFVAARAATDQENLDRLVAAYPEALKSHDAKNLYWRDGTSMPVDDGVPNKPFNQLLRRASILDQFHFAYPRGTVSTAPAAGFDPGRFRNEAFFRKMYGDCRKGEVARNLTTIVWLPKTWGKRIQVTKVNGISDHLKQISAEIDELEPRVKDAAYPIAGVLSCRPVADTGSMSMHSYAAAIDLNLKFSDYWLWAGAKGQPQYRNHMPLPIVEIFERHGFIWGGKWSHYDTMHFEYRPELLGTDTR